MRENCTYSSEGGVTFKPSSLPLSRRSRVIRGLRITRQRCGVRWQGGKGLTPLWMNVPRYARKTEPQSHILPVKKPKRRSTGALQDALALSGACESRASFVESSELFRQQFFSSFFTTVHGLSWELGQERTTMVG
jgi:hypothetical protein